MHLLPPRTARAAADERSTLLRGQIVVTGLRCAEAHLVSVRVRVRVRVRFMVRVRVRARLRYGYGYGYGYG